MSTLVLDLDVTVAPDVAAEGARDGSMNAHPSATGESRRARLLGRFFPLGFATRLALATSALIVLICVAQAWILVQRDLERIRGYLADRGRTISAYLARDSELSILSGNTDELRWLAAQACAHPDVAYAAFFDAEGRLLASAGDTPGSDTAEAAAANAGPVAVRPGFWEFRVPVLTTDGRPQREEIALLGESPRPAGAQHRVGTVAVGISLASFESFRRQTFATATLLTSLFTIVAVLSAVAVARAITRPMRSRAATSRRRSRSARAMRSGRSPAPSTPWRRALRAATARSPRRGTPRSSRRASSRNSSPT